jgi:hypothetical protein
MSHTGRFDGCVILTSIHSHLFSNFFVGFARSFGCTLPPAPLPKTNGPVSLAYAHKFMDLEYHQLGYFINVSFEYEQPSQRPLRTGLLLQPCEPATAYEPLPESNMPSCGAGERLRCLCEPHSFRDRQQ